MNHLLRSLAPISDAGWKLVDEEAPATPGADGSLGIGSLKGMQR